MQVPYSLETLETDNGSIVVVVKNNSAEKKLTIVVTISGYHDETDNGFRASTEFFEGDNRIEDLKSLVKNKKFWNIIEYYHNATIDLPFKGEEDALLNDNRSIREPERTVKGTNFLYEVARSVATKSSSKINRTLDPNFLIAFGSIRQGFSVYTTFKNYNQEEITLARTYTGMGAYAKKKYAYLTLFDRNLATVFSFLHLANVTLANRLILKQTSDIITGIEKVVSYIRRRALPYSLVIAAVHSAAVAIAPHYLGNASGVSQLQSFPDLYQLGTLVYLIVLPLIWPIAGFLVRMYAPKIFPVIVRYAIKRILNLK